MNVFHRLVSLDALANSEYDCMMLLLLLFVFTLMTKHVRAVRCITVNCWQAHVGKIRQPENHDHALYLNNPTGLHHEMASLDSAQLRLTSNTKPETVKMGSSAVAMHSL